jgi:hypothetical protein
MQLRLEGALGTSIGEGRLTSLESWPRRFSASP